MDQRLEEDSDAIRPELAECRNAVCLGTRVVLCHDKVLV